jgi:DNA modification methylase
MSVQLINISELTVNPNNPRIIKDEKFDKLVQSIKEFPDMLKYRPIVVDENNVILGGNMRFKACKAAKLKQVHVMKASELTEAQKREFIIKDNVSGGEWDWVMLQNEWDTEQLDAWGLDIPDFEPEHELEAVEDDYEIPDEIHTDIVLGDLFEIGEHRLLCGDSTDSDAVARLMDGKKADMVFTDPPYGIKVVKSEMVGADFGIAKKGKYSEVIADDTTDTANEFYQTCISLGFDKFIIWGGNYFTDFLPFSDGWLIWNKRAGTDIRNTFADGEMAWCSFHTPIRIYDQLWNGMIREGEKDKRVHPTQKPIRMLSQVIYDHVKGNLIFDGFLGSGSTMVASHQLKRKCYGIELDPKYCQVIVDRMIKLDPTLTIKRNGHPYLQRKNSDAKA